jgi:hypothetical protein
LYSFIVHEGRAAWAPQRAQKYQFKSIVPFSILLHEADHHLPGADQPSLAIPLHPLTLIDEA